MGVMLSGMAPIIITAAIVAVAWLLIAVAVAVAVGLFIHEAEQIAAEHGE